MFGFDAGGFIGFLILYFLPIAVAGIRGHKSYGSVIVVNIFLGWTVIGWVVALAMAFSGNVDTQKNETENANADRDEAKKENWWGF